jgi:hypothetical protein
MWTKFALRDSAIVAAAAAFWWFGAGYSAGDGLVADFAGVVAGGLVGAAAYVLHEWGHVAGARAAGGVMEPAGRLSAAFMFRFDPHRNSLGQFVTMSLGGFAATGLILWGVYALAPEGLLATRVARGAVLFLTFLGVALEAPLLVYSLVVRAVPEQAAVSIARGPAPGEDS